MTNVVNVPDDVATSVLRKILGTNPSDMVKVKVYNAAIEQEANVEFPIELPKYQTSGAAAMDAHSIVDEYLNPGQCKLIPTGLFVEIPDGFKINVLPRSGLAFKHGVTVLNTPGLIDSDYRNGIGVLLINFGSDPFYVKRGDRIAQLEIAPVFLIQWDQVSTKDALSTTARGGGGFGSTKV